MNCFLENLVWNILLFSNRKKKKVKVNHKIDFCRGTYGVRRWQYENFDCIDLYIELLIIINCEIIDRCRPCHLFLKWIVQLLIYGTQ